MPPKKLQVTDEPSRRQKAILRAYFDMPTTGAGSKPRKETWVTLRVEYNKQIDLQKNRSKYYKTVPGKRDWERIVNPQFAKARQYFRRAVLRKQPKFVSQTLLDRIRFFTKYSFNYSNVNTRYAFYKAIKDALLRFPNASSISIHIRNKESGNKIRSISITTNDTTNFNDFNTALDRIISGNFPGSDAVNLNDDEIIYEYFALSSALVSGGSSSDKMMFYTEGIEETTRTIEVKGKEKIIGNHDCAKQCLLKLVEEGEITLNDFIINKREDLIETPACKLSKIDDLIKYIVDNHLPINVMYNGFTLRRPHNEIVADGNMERINIPDTKRKGLERLYICSKLNMSDIHVSYAYKIDTEEFDYEEAVGTIIYDEFNQHYDIITNRKPMLLDNILISANSQIIKNNQVIFTPRQVNINTKQNGKINRRFLIFDYETVIDFTKSSCMREYSLSVLNLSNEELEALTDADVNNKPDKIKQIRDRCCMTFLGFDCSIQFIKWILLNQMDTAFVFVGFNNANFDNFILLDSLLRYNEVNNEYSVSDIFYNGSQLLNFYMNGRHNTFDIHKHLVGSLKSLCESFKITCCAKKSFDHNKAQQLYLDGKLIDFITDNDELKEYNEYDVLATAVLFCKYRRALSEIKCTNPYSDDLHNIKTIGSLIYRVFEKSKSKKKFNLPKLSFDEYTRLQECKVAGRVELFNGIQKIEERMASGDVCSLYPYTMSVAPVYYPCGEKVDTDIYQGADVIGFYYCNIDQSNLRGSNLPKIYPKKSKIENDWGHEEVLENYLISNVMIELLKEFNCKVEIIKGFYFTDRMKSCEMFDFILDLMKAKNEQDTKKKNKDTSYNPALRETLKLLMNSLSGKVIEGLHTEKTTDICSLAEYEKIKQKATSINFINCIGSKIFMTYEVDAEDIIHKQRPIYLGVLIYDYAKSYMYRYSYSKVGLKDLVYTDTDASKMRYTAFLEWKEWIDKNNIQVPHWKEVEEVDERYKNHKVYDPNSKVFGSFEDELEEMTGDKYVFYCLEKKSWCYSADNNAKFRFKGLNENAIILSTEEDFIETKTINHREGNVETKYKLKEDSELDVYNFAQNNKHLSIGAGNEVNFFEKLHSSGEAYLLCNSFRKIVKNSAHNVEIGDENRYNNLMNKIQVNYNIKKITLK
jgi:hypothetical protein